MKDRPLGVTLISLCFWFLGIGLAIFTLTSEQKCSIYAYGDINNNSFYSNRLMVIT
jgi:hypothetical protein